MIGLLKRGHLDAADIRFNFMDPKSSSRGKVVPLQGKLCILGYELAINGDELEEGGVRGSAILDDLFDCNVPYSTALLSCTPAFYQEQIEFPVVVDHILGVLYKHPNHWTQLKKALASDEGHVTLYICPLSGVPMIIPSDKIYKVTVNGLMIQIKGLGLSRLSKLTHQNIDEDAASKALEYLRDVGFIGEFIDNMDEFISYLFGLVGGSGDEYFVEFMQELLYSGEVFLDIDLESGDILVDTSLSEDLEDGESISDLLGYDDIDLEDDLMDEDELPDRDLEEELQVLDETENQNDLVVKREDLKNPESVFMKGTDTFH